MPRRVTMPGADELFRPTASPSSARPGAEDAQEPAETPAESTETNETPERASGRIKHDEKMTVYLTSAELLAIEQARLQLRSTVGRNIDRGRLVRAALAIVLEDLDAHGDDSPIVRRLEGA